MNPLDADARGIAKGSVVRVESPEGAVEVTVNVTDRIIPGTVSFNEGLWPALISRDEEVLDQAGAVNILTSTEPTLPSRSSRTHTVFVEVRNRS